MRKATKKFDTYDIAILSALERNPRASMVDLAGIVHLSRTAISRRINILRDNGAFLDIADTISYPVLGFDIEATVEIATPSNGVAGISQRLLELPEVLAVATTTGYGHLVLRVIATDMSHFRQFVDNIQIYGDVSTSLVISTTKSPLPLTQRLKMIRQRSQEIDMQASG